MSTFNLHQNYFIMKTKLLLLSSLFACLSFGQVSNSNLVAYYNFESSGVNQLNPGTFNLGPLAANGANPTYTEDGIFGSCVNFSGLNCLSNSNELKNHLAAQTDQSLTISFWMKSNNIEDGLKTFVEGFESVVVRGRVPSFFISRTEGIYQSGLADNANNDDGPFFADTNVWNHLVYVYNAANNTLKGYINNMLMVDVTLTGSETAIFQYSSRFVVGAGVNNSSINWTQKAYTGKIDEMFVFSRAITASEVQALYDLQMPQSECPDASSISLTSQEEVDAFVAQYPNCTEIIGDFEISGLSINDISALEYITLIDGELSIIGTSLTNLEGLNNIESFNSLTISNNALLTTIEDLGMEGIIANEINITDNPLLESLEGLSNVSNDYFGYIFLMDLPLVTSLEPLSNFTGTASFYIQNLAITDLTGLEQITNTNFILLINLPSLTSLEGLNQLTSFINLSNVRFGNDLPNQINGFSSGLIIDNTSISNLSPLNSLISLANNNLGFYDNPNLTNLEGLSNLNPDSVNQLEIAGNSSLSNCAISVICQIIDSENTEFVNIETNNENCNSVEEVQAICANLSSDVFESAIEKVYPNPFNNQINVVLNHPNDKTDVSLFDISGKVLMSQSFLNNEEIILNTENLNQGVYFLNIQNESGKNETIKLVK